MREPPVYSRIVAGVRVVTARKVPDAATLLGTLATPSMSVGLSRWAGSISVTQSPKLLATAKPPPGSALTSSELPLPGTLPSTDMSPVRISVTVLAARLTHANVAASAESARDAGPSGTAVFAATRPVAKSTFQTSLRSLTDIYSALCDPSIAPSRSTPSTSCRTNGFCAMAANAPMNTATAQTARQAREYTSILTGYLPGITVQKAATGLFDCTRSRSWGCTAAGAAGAGCAFTWGAWACGAGAGAACCGAAPGAPNSDCDTLPWGCCANTSMPNMAADNTLIIVSRLRYVVESRGHCAPRSRTTTRIP